MIYNNFGNLPNPMIANPPPFVIIKAPAKLVLYDSRLNDSEPTSYRLYVECEDAEYDLRCGPEGTQFYDDLIPWDEADEVDFATLDEVYQWLMKNLPLVNMLLISSVFKNKPLEQEILDSLQETGFIRR